jgi:hypothetical protein
MDNEKNTDNLEAQLEDLAAGTVIDEDHVSGDDIQKGDVGATDAGTAKEQMNQEDGIEIL